MSVALDALGNPVRRQMLRLLAVRPRAVAQLTAALDVDISRPAVSKHLRLLEDARLVTHDPRGTRNIYRLEPRGFDEARAALDAFWDEALPRLKMLAENTRPANPRDEHARKDGGRRE